MQTIQSCTAYISGIYCVSGDGENISMIRDISCLIKGGQKSEREEVMILNTQIIGRTFKKYFKL